MKLRINPKCSDLFSASLVDDNGEFLGDYAGYVPDFMPGEHYGDYVELDIDTNTGQITNWPKGKDLNNKIRAFFKKNKVQPCCGRPEKQCDCESSTQEKKFGEI